MSQFNYCLVRPEDLDLAVPASPATLQQIMSRYPLSWVRASNCSYHAGDSTGNAVEIVGLIAERGTVYSKNPAGWPALYVHDGKAWFVEADLPPAAGVNMALGAGPMLVR